MTRKLIALTLCLAFVCSVVLTGCAAKEEPPAPAEDGAAAPAPPMPEMPPLPEPPAPPAEGGDEVPAE